MEAVPRDTRVLALVLDPRDTREAVDTALVTGMEVVRRDTRDLHLMMVPVMEMAMEVEMEVDPVNTTTRVATVCLRTTRIMTDLVMVLETEMDPERDQVLEMECPRDLAKDPVLVLMMDIPEEAMDLATDPVKEAAVTRRDTKGLVPEMDPDRAKAVERALDLVRTMDLALVPRDTRE